MMEKYPAGSAFKFFSLKCGFGICCNISQNNWTFGVQTKIMVLVVHYEQEICNLQTNQVRLDLFTLTFPNDIGKK